MVLIFLLYIKNEFSCIADVFLEPPATRRALQYCYLCPVPKKKHCSCPDGVRVVRGHCAACRVQAQTDRSTTCTWRKEGMEEGWEGVRKGGKKDGREEGKKGTKEG